MFVADYCYVDDSGPYPMFRWKSIDSVLVDQELKDAYVHEFKKRLLVFQDMEDDLI